MGTTTTSNVHPALYRYIGSACQRQASAIRGADWRDLAQGTLLRLWDDGADLSRNNDDTRRAASYVVLHLATDERRAAQRRGDMPDDGIAASGLWGMGSVTPAIGSADVWAAAWDRLRADDVDLYRLLVWSTYAPRHGGAGGLATGTVLPYADRQDRVTRGARLRQAAAMLDAHRDAIVAALAEAHIDVMPDGVPAVRRQVRPVPVTMYARPDWDDETRAVADQVSGPLSRADLRGLFRHDVRGPFGTLSGASGPRVRTGSKRAAVPSSALASVGTAAGLGRIVGADTWQIVGHDKTGAPILAAGRTADREHLDSERHAPTTRQDVDTLAGAGEWAPDGWADDEQRDLTTGAAGIGGAYLVAGLPRTVAVPADDDEADVSDERAEAAALSDRASLLSASYVSALRALADGTGSAGTVRRARLRWARARGAARLAWFRIHLADEACATVA